MPAERDTGREREIYIYIHLYLYLSIHRYRYRCRYIYIYIWEVEHPDSRPLGVVCDRQAVHGLGLMTTLRGILQREACLADLFSLQGCL